MARSRSPSGSRDVNTVTTGLDFTLPVRPALLSRPVLDPVTDLRIFNPQRDLLGPLEVIPSRPGIPFRLTPARMVDRSVDRTPVSRRTRMGNPVFAKSSTRAIWAFKEPRNVPVCVRRTTRRQVLFAKGKSGRGYRKPRWNQRSYMRCK